MKIFGWVVVGFGTAGLLGAVVLEIMMKEPIYMLFIKISMGIMAIGGTILGIKSLPKGG